MRDESQHLKAGVIVEPTRGYCNTGALVSDAFVCYHRQDQDLATTLVGVLRDHGCRVWFDLDLSEDTDWEQAIRSGLATTGSFVVLLSPRSPSLWVRKELDWALARRGVDPQFPVVPVAHRALGELEACWPQLNQMRTSVLDDSTGASLIRSVKQILLRLTPGKLNASMGIPIGGGSASGFADQVHDPCQWDHRWGARMRTEEATWERYHDSYRKLRRAWSDSPLDSITSFYRSAEHRTIGDFGAGEGELGKRLPMHDVRGFDFHSLSDQITACDMSATPIPDSTLDAAVFSLSLMGWDAKPALAEASRTLKDSGVIHIVQPRHAATRASVQHTLGRFGFSMEFRELGMFTHTIAHRGTVPPELSRLAREAE